MIKLLLVGFGGFIGAISRYWIGSYFEGHSEFLSFPVGILIVNLVGCLIIGMLAGLAESTTLISEEIKLLLFVGLLGSFTTFSTFSHDTMNLITNGLFIHAMLNVLISVVIGIVAVALGFKSMQLIFN
jgi:CrcB protein